MKISADLIDQRPKSLLPELGLTIDAVIDKVTRLAGEPSLGSGLIVDFLGDPTNVIARISALEFFEPRDLIFVDKANVVGSVIQRSNENGKPGLIVTNSKLADAFSGVVGANILKVHSVPLAHAVFKQIFATRDFSRTGWMGVHPSAVIHETAILDKSVIVEPRAVIGAGARLSRGVRRYKKPQLLPGDKLPGARQT